MNEYYLPIVQTLIILTVYGLIRSLSGKVIDKTLNRRLLQESRGIILKKFVNAAAAFICILLFVLIWGINREDLFVFIGSVLTVLGIAFFAQWSILSNITSSVIIFFNHPVKFNDTVSILEGKDYIIEGRVVNIGLFFVTLETPDGEEITIPNNIFIQKSIKNTTHSPPRPTPVVEREVPSP
jgi:small-conductance mechanosensitive channel